MIKRKYKRPEIMFENFRMDSAIAACDATVEIGTGGNFATAGIYDPDWGVWIFDTTVPGSRCTIWQECKHVPTDNSQGGLEDMGGFYAS